MDGDPSVEPELDSFSLFLPLPYRVALIIVLGTDSCPIARTAMLTGPRRLGMGCQSSLSKLDQDSRSTKNCLL